MSLALLRCSQFVALPFDAVDVATEKMKVAFLNSTSTVYVDHLRVSA